VNETADGRRFYMRDTIAGDFQGESQWGEWALSLIERLVLIASLTALMLPA
jgi:hypothetical protein